jgi:hypothetical protein
VDSRTGAVTILLVPSRDSLEYLYTVTTAVEYIVAAADVALLVLLWIAADVAVGSRS